MESNQYILSFFKITHYRLILNYKLKILKTNYRLLTSKVNFSQQETQRGPLAPFCFRLWAGDLDKMWQCSAALFTSYPSLFWIRGSESWTQDNPEESLVHLSCPSIKMISKRLHWCFRHPLQKLDIRMHCIKSTRSRALCSALCLLSLFLPISYFFIRRPEMYCNLSTSFNGWFRWDFKSASWFSRTDNKK